MKRVFCIGLLIAGLGILTVQVSGQGMGPGPAAFSTESGSTTIVHTKSATVSQFYQVVFRSGVFGLLLWVGLFGVGGFAVYFSVHSSILLLPRRTMPHTLVNAVTEAVRDGDVMAVLQACERGPGTLANILTAGFRHVEDGFDVIQESIKSAADLESEKIMQRLTWLSVIANIAPMIGLLGTVQGMILAFQTTSTGTLDVAMLGLAIAQALWTTAAGLCIAVPSIALHYALKNKANTILLQMENLTTELIKGLRNVEIVSG